jgi:hypothetical protein
MQGALQQLEKLGQQAQQTPQPSAGGSSSGTSAAPSAPVDAAQALNAVGQVLSGGQKVNVVDFRDLKAMLPDTLAGMPRKDVSGERTEAMGMQTSHATAHYRDAAGGSLQVEIADLGSMSGLAGLALKFNPNVEKETERGYERTTTVNGQLLHEEYDRVSKSGEVNAIVGNRFSVEVRGSGVDMDVMKKSIAQIDMGKLAAVASAK